MPQSTEPSSATSGGVNVPLTIGIALLAVGLVALFGGFTVAEMRRRRALARARRG